LTSFLVLDVTPLFALRIDLTLLLALRPMRRGLKRSVFLVHA